MPLIEERGGPTIHIAILIYKPDQVPISTVLGSDIDERWHADCTIMSELV